MRKARRRAFVHPPCTTESFPTLASPGCRSPWELVPRWEFPPRCHTMEIPRSLRGRTWLIRPTPYETSSFLRAALVCARVDGRGAKGASVFSGFPEFATSFRMQDPDSSMPLENEIAASQKKDIARTLSLRCNLKSHRGTSSCCLAAAHKIQTHASKSG